ncbi:MAG: hypothetical protein ABH891_07050 [Candidatus Omnitrophota bacterium]
MPHLMGGAGTTYGIEATSLISAILVKMSKWATSLLKSCLAFQGFFKITAAVLKRGKKKPLTRKRHKLYNPNRDCRQAGDH